MAELRKCSRCSSTIQLMYFSVNRKGEYYKCCDKCRENKRRYINDNADKIREIKHTYWINNKNEINCKREALKEKARDSDGTLFYCNRCYTIKPFDEFVCPNGKTYNACYKCLDRRYN